MIPLKQSLAGQDVPVRLFNNANNPVTGVTAPTIQVSKSGAALVAVSDGAWTEIGSGCYNIQVDATDTNTVGYLLVIVTGTGFVDAPVLCWVRANTEKDIDDKLGAPAGASVSADIAANLVAVNAVGTAVGLLNDLSALQVENAVWNAARSAHTGATTFGGGVLTEDLNAAAKASVNAEVDAALDTAIPGSPTADSINERIKTLDDNYTVTRAGNLDNLDQALSTTESNIRGSDGDDLKDISDEIAGVSAAIGLLNDLSATQVENAVWDASKAAHTTGTTFGDLGNKIDQSLSATETNIRGADGDDLKDISDEIGLLNNLSAAQVNAEVDTALADINLDHLMAVAATGSDVVDDSVIAQLASKSATADWDTFDNTADSLEALADALAGSGLTAQQVRDAMKLAPTVGAPAVGSVDAHLDTIEADTTAIVAKLPTGTISDFDEASDLVDLNADQSTVTFGTVNALGTTAKADVNAEVDAALDTAIPGSPTADSINERIKTLDDNYTAARAGNLDNLDQAISTTESNLMGTGSRDLTEVYDLVGALNNLSALQVENAVWDAAKSSHTGGTTFGDLGQKVDQAISVTESNIRGTDGDDLKDLSDQMDALQTSIDGISNVTRLSTALPKYMQRPSSGDKAVFVKVALKDTTGQMEDPDNSDIGLKVYNSAGTSRNANLYQDQALTTSLVASLYAGRLKLVKTATGLYEFYYKVNAADAEEELIFDFYWEESSVGLTEFRSSQITDAANDLTAIKLQTDKLTFDGSSRIISNARAISDSTTAADDLEANIGYLDQSLVTMEADIRGTDGDDLKDISDEIAALSIPTVGQIENAVWNAARSGHTNVGSMGETMTDLDTKLPTGTISDFDETSDLVDLNADQSGVTIGTVNALGTTAKADVLAEVNSALNTAVPGSPTADSLFERIQTLDDNYTAARAPNLDNLDQAISTTESNIRGSDGDDLKDLSDQLDAVSTAIGALNNLSAAQVNAEVDTALSDINLDHLMAVAATGADVVDDSAIAQMVSKAGTADWDTFDNTADSLEAIADAMSGSGLTAQQVRDAMKLAPTGGAPAGGSVDAHLDNIETDTTAIVAKLPTGTISDFDETTDKVDLNANQSSVTVGTVTVVDSLGTTAKADVNAEVDAALDTAIPASPTADSINERIKTLDDNYTPARAGYLDDLDAPISTAIADIATNLSAINAVGVLVAGQNDLSALQVENAVWDAVLAAHPNIGSTGLALATAAAGGSPTTIAAAVWDLARAGHTGPTTFGGSIDALDTKLPAGPIAEPGDQMDLVPATLAQLTEYIPRRSVSYDDTGDVLTILAWLEIEGEIVASPTSVAVDVLDEDGTNVFAQLTSSSPQTDGVFKLTQSAPGLTPAKSYQVKVAVVHNAITYTNIKNIVTVGA